MISEEELKQHKIREFAPDGRLVRSGLWWRERRPALNSLFIYASGFLFLIAAAAAVLAVIAFANSNVVGAIGGIVVGVAAFAAMQWINKTGAMFRYFRRTVVFADDGSIFLENQPRGLHVYDCRKPAVLVATARKYPAIASIEMRPDDRPLDNPSLKPGETRPAPAKTFSVFIFFRDGQHIWKSKNLFEDEARWVVVQLTEALKEIRASIAGGSQKPHVSTY